MSEINVLFQIIDGPYKHVTHFAYLEDCIFFVGAPAAALNRNRNAHLKQNRLLNHGSLIITPSCQTKN